MAFKVRKLARKSLKVRVCSGVTLLAMVVGPLRVAYAIPAAGALPAPSPLVPPASAAGGGLAVQSLSRSEHRPVSAPPAMSSRILPADVTVLQGPVSSDAAQQLFDGRATRGLTSPGPTQIRIQLESPTAVTGSPVLAPPTAP